MSLKLTIAACVLSAAAGAYTMKRLAPIETKTEVVEKIVYKDKVVTVTREVVRPDGTRETETSKVEDKVITDDKKQSQSIAYFKPDWHLSLGASVSFDALVPVYAFRVERRILGPFFLGASVSTNKAVGVSLGFEF